MDRTVRHLRVQAASHVEAQRFGSRLAESLRLADLHDGDGRLRFLRRVALGRVPAGASPAMLAAAWESAVAAAGGVWMHGGSRDAVDADAVWFADALDAHLCLARRVLQGAPVDAWYWKHAVPQWHPGMEVHAALRTLALGLLDRDEAAAALPAWIAALVREGHAHAVPGLFTASDMPRLHHGLGSGFASAMARVARAVQDGAGMAASASAPASVDMTGQDAPAPGGASPVIGAPGMRAAALLLMAGSSPPAAWLQTHAQRPGRPAARGQGEGLQIAFTAIDARQCQATPGATREGAAPEPTSITAMRRADRLPEARAPGDPANHAVVLQGEPTLAGGLALLLPALRRLGYPGWLHAEPEWTSPPVLAQLFGRILARLPVPADDPAWTLAAAAPPAHPAPSRFTAPASWMPALQRGRGTRSRRAGAHRLRYDRSGRLLLAAMPARKGAGGTGGSRGAAVPLDLVAGAWQVALHRYLRRVVGIGLHDLVMRTARLSISATHLDLEYRMAQVDVRLRRHGLDLDPGWLPWAGRVVTFHYRDGDGR